VWQDQELRRRYFREAKRGFVIALGFSFFFTGFFLKTFKLENLLTAIIFAVIFSIATPVSTLFAPLYFKRYKFWQSVLANTVVNLVIVVLCLSIGLLVTMLIINRLPLHKAISQTVGILNQREMGIIMVVTFLAIFFVRFVLIDLVGSTRITERLGNVEYSRFLQRFFDAFTVPLEKTRGEVVHYLGDAVIVSFSPGQVVKKGLMLKDAPGWMNFVVMARQVLAQKTPAFESEFGVAPQFRLVAHCGEVVAAEVGQIKSEITYHGECLNELARIESLAKELAEDVLVSSELVDSLGGSRSGVEFHDKGVHSLKNVSEQMRVFSLS
jgi:class 3 adenylate cyclase